MVVTNPFEELIALLQKLLDTIGLAEDPSEESSILFQMLENALNNGLVNEFLDGLTDSGKNLNDVLRSVIVDHSRQLLEALVHSWIALQRPVEELLQAVYAIQAEALDEVFQVIIEMYARKMTPAEIAQAQLIYGNSFDYDTIYFSESGVVNDVIFQVQSYFNDTPGARPFVTFKLVNHDASSGHMTNRTMIHELCHVWQFQEAGPIYMIEALHAQYLGDGYNYGYSNFVNGDGAEATLQNAITNNPGMTPAEVFETFNREQQAQIIMHYYQRRYVESPPLNYAPWAPFQQVVFT